MLEKRAYLVLLFDFYGGLLTEKQCLMFDLYYQWDLSLGEIAEQQKISRQAVYDIIKRSEKALEEYEEKLGLVKKFQDNKEKLRKALELIDKLENQLTSSKNLNEENLFRELKILLRSVVQEQ